MSEERKFVYMRKTRSGNGVRMRDGEIVYIASIRSLEAFLQGEREFVAFAKMPYRKIPNETITEDIGGRGYERRIVIEIHEEEREEKGDE